jgi:hypothetical protein
VRRGMPYSAAAAAGCGGAADVADAAADDAAATEERALLDGLGTVISGAALTVRRGMPYSAAAAAGCGDAFAACAAAGASGAFERDGVLAAGFAAGWALAADGGRGMP